MAVLVVAAAGDDGDPRPELAQLGREPGILGAVVGDLEDLDLRKREVRRDVGLRVRREEDVRLAVGRDQDDGVQVRVLRDRPLVRGPEHAQAEPSGPVGRARANDVDRYVSIARGAERLLVLRAGRREIRVEHPPDPEPADHVRGASDVVALRMRQDERRQRADPHAQELLRRVALGRALVDEHPRARRLEQDRVALPDVEERDAQPGRRLPDGLRHE